jgi:GNAT superfamily N-acetyltransferase
MTKTRTDNDIVIRVATVDDVPAILGFIRDLAEYEKLAHEVVATEAALRSTLFGARPAAEVIIAELAGHDDADPLHSQPAPVGFALFFQSYSTFLAKPGLYLEDLFVRPAARGRGVGSALLAALAKITIDRDYGRLEWSVLDWNEPAIRLYRAIGAAAMDQWTIQRMTGAPLAALAAKWPHPIG